MKSKKQSVTLPPYNVRIRKYNEEKQSALLLASNQKEVDRIIRFLRKKWNV